MAEDQKTVESFNQEALVKSTERKNMTNENQNSYRVTAGELRAFVERIERLEVEKKELSDQVKEVFAELKGRGYDGKVIRKIIAVRKLDPNDASEQDAVFQLYSEALGMS